MPFYVLFSGALSPVFLFSCDSVCHFGLVVFCHLSLIILFFMFSISALDLCFVVTARFV